MHSITAGGAEIPALGLGTYPMEGGLCRRAVETALELGYRHVDTAQSYGNEAAVGAAIRESPVPREEVFLVTKVDRSNLAYEDVLASVDRSLERLDTGIDLLLIHAPSESVPVSETLAAMNELQDRGDVAHVGVSNFSVAQLEAAIDASRTPIVANQVAYHVYERREELRRYCTDEDVALVAFSPLAKGRAVDDEALEAIGRPYGKTAAQVALRWLLQQDGVAAVPKAASPAHQAENADVFDFELTPAEMEHVRRMRGGLAERLLALIGMG